MKNPLFYLMALIALALLVVPKTGFAKPQKKDSGPTEVALPAEGGKETKGPKEADVEKIQEKYWARGQESEIGVVQNRLFSNERKFELGALLGSVASDPFLVNTSLNLTAGYHFSELLSLHLGFAKNFVTGSAALSQLEATSGGLTAATNKQQWWLTIDSRWSMLYGKVSLFGSKILYFDAYLSGGFGAIKTESGTSFAFMPGIGQIFHISQTLAINLHYKLFWYKETILSKNTATLGTPLGTHNNFGGAVLVGVSITLDPLGPKPATAETEAQGPAPNQ